MKTTNNTTESKYTAENIMTAWQNEPLIMLIVNTLKDGGSMKFVHFQGNVEVKMNKGGKSHTNPLADEKVTKKGIYSIMVNASYRNAVNKEREREGLDKKTDFKEPWYTYVIDTDNGGLVYSTNHPERGYYLRYILNTNNPNSKPYTFIGYFVNGVPATPEQVEIIQQYKQERSEPAKQGDNGEVLDRPVYPEVIKIENIEVLNANGYIMEFIR